MGRSCERHPLSDSFDESTIKQKIFNHLIIGEKSANFVPWILVNLGKFFVKKDVKTEQEIGQKLNKTNRHV